MEKWVTTPTNAYEFLLSAPWPITWAYWVLGAIILAGSFVALRGPRGNEAGTKQKVARKQVSNSLPRRLLFFGLPLLWLVWQCLATAHSVSPQLSTATLKHFTACIVCFFLGLLSLRRTGCLWPFSAGLLCGFLLVLTFGWDQHLGGLEETRRYFFAYLYDHSTALPPEYLKKIRSERIYSTLFYPNTLAGVLLLLLPAMLVTIWRLPAGGPSTPRARTSKYFRLAGFGTGTLASFCFLRFGSKGASVLALLFALPMLLPMWRACITGLLALAALACLYWSGSKGGWLLMLLLGLIVLFRLPMGKKFKIALTIGIFVFGLAGFFWKYSDFFKKGATSVSARFDYWRAALQTAKDNPVFGTGPGTFAIPYEKLKRPDAEMARLVHNDYLEQASDSGVVGWLTYTIFIVAALILGFPKNDWPAFSVWLGVLGWSLQSLFEFGLYIPALAWPAFALLGWLLARSRNPIDKPSVPA